MKLKQISFAAIIFVSFALVFLFTGIKIKKMVNMPVYKDPSSAVNDRVEDLLKRMTPEEKIDLLGGTGFATKPIERLGIPPLKMTDGPLGVRWGKSTAFPAGIAMASTWDTSIINKLGSAIGREVKGKGRDVILGPCVNIARIPMGGRNFESFGEDPFLASRMAVSYIEGVQKENVAATVKHFAANNQEYERMFVNVKVNERALNEIYLPAFKAAVKEANVLCVMSAYNKVDGAYCSENDYLLKIKLKDDWKFDGLVISDWGAVHSTIPTAQGGLDLEMPTGKYLNNATLSDAVKNGTVSEKTINDKVRSILRIIIKLGLIDHPRKENPALINSKENQQIALQTAREGIVLLKNADSILPLNKNKLKSIAVIGPNAAIARTGGGSSRVTPVFSVSPLDALKQKLGTKVKINYAPGISLDGDASAIESSFLFQPGDKENGLKGEYFNNKNLKGDPSFTRIDKQIDFDWGNGSPGKRLDKDNFSVRWTGYIKPVKSGDYMLDVLSDDGTRLFVNDKLVIDDWKDHGAETHSCKINFEAGKKYKIKLEYYENAGGALVKLSWRFPGEDLIKNAVEAAVKSDVAIIFAGTSDQYESEGKDRDNLILPNNQDKLINAVAEVNKNVIVVLTTGSPVLMNKWINNVNGIIETWFGGEEIGNAVTDVLLGNYNPSGKLPITFLKRWEDCSAYNTYKKQDSVSKYSDGIFVGYRHFDEDNIEPLFPFGYGLSYTKFAYSNLKIRDVQNDKLYNVSFELKNTGKVPGTEIAQVYISSVNSKIKRAPKELKAFKRIQLKAGESINLEIPIKKDAFAYYNSDKHNWVTAPGEYKILIGSSSRDIRLSGKVNVK